MAIGPPQCVVGYALARSQLYQMDSHQQEVEETGMYAVS